MHCQIEADWLHSCWGSLTRSTFELLICFECRLLTGNSQLEDPNSFHFPSLGGCCSNYWDLFKGNFYIKGTGCEEMKLKEIERRKESFEGFQMKARTDTRPIPRLFYKRLFLHIVLHCFNFAYMCFTIDCSNVRWREKRNTFETKKKKFTFICWDVQMFCASKCKRWC